jgi:hypothetical protein
MEDAVSGKMIDSLLPDGVDVPFAEIEATLARLAHDASGRKRPSTRALMATVIVVGSEERLVPAAGALEQLNEGVVRTILISEGQLAEPVVRVSETAVAVCRLSPQYLNNAVAALRLSSLPAVVWWRGGSIAAFDDLTDLADRFIMDTERPNEVWTHAVGLFENTALTDLRWTALTRWRSALAHLFDLPAVRRGVTALKRVRIESTDAPSARLYAGWLKSSLSWPAGATIDIRTSDGASDSPLECVVLDCNGVAVTLKMREGRPCFEATAGISEAARIVPTGDGSLAALIGEELGVRTRDLAFERALVKAQEMAA